MPRSAEYLIAQYFQTPMRREARNIGIVVIAADSRGAKFLTETTEGQIDRRSLKWMPHPNIYQKWIKYWREQLRKGVDAVKLAATNGDNYNLIPGGIVTDIGEDSAEVVAGNLFSMLVAGHTPEVAKAEDLEEDVSGADKELQEEVAVALKTLGILGVKSPGVHGVLRSTSVSGKKASYTPTFYQQNGRPYAMETVNFATTRKGPAVYHAGYSALMFSDLRAQRPDTEGIMILRGTAKDMADERTRNALKFLSEKDRIVQWDSDEQRKAFLSERERVALSAGDESN
jgi:hypothetical protein